MQCSTPEVRSFVTRDRCRYPYLIQVIGWEVRVSRMGPLRLGPRGRTDGVGQYKTPGIIGVRGVFLQGGNLGPKGPHLMI